MLPSLCIFFAAAASSFYALVGEPHGPLKIISLLAAYLLAWSIASWIQSDAMQRDGITVYDFDTLVFAFWPVAAPVYLFRTRGWGAIRPIGIFLLLLSGGMVLAAVLAYPQSVAYFHAQRS
jgi:hypothetical protein